MRQKCIERQVAGHGHDGIRDGDIACPEAGLLLNLLWIYAGHGGGITIDEHVAFAVASVEDLIVRLPPDPGTVMEEEVGSAECDERRDGKQRQEDEDEAITQNRIRPGRANRSVSQGGLMGHQVGSLVAVNHHEKASYIVR